ncbi:N-acetylneuraminate synthase [Oryzomonas japonica]|nr:N-acetylneuraminate synthase [Oryzomonas japonica]
MMREQRTYIIAEAGVNHNGSLEIAKELVDAARLCGADAVKFQTFKAEKLVTRSAAKADYQKRDATGGDSQFEMLKRLELKEGDFRELFAHCHRCGIEFMSSPFDEESADLLDSLGMSTFKVPSGEITNHPLLEHIARKGKPVILSTGMSTLGEVEEALGIFHACGNPCVTLLHCVTEYPAPYGEINLNAMLTLREAFRAAVGYSDHTPGIEIPLAAVSLGARVIEKHFTLDNAMEGPDHKASLNPADFMRMVQAIRNVEQAMGDGIKRPAPCELKNIDIARKSVVAAETIAEGEIISIDKLTVKRPGYGVQPKDMEKLVGLRVNKTIAKDDVLKWHYLA